MPPKLAGLLCAFAALCGWGGQRRAANAETDARKLRHYFSDSGSLLKADHGSRTAKHSMAGFRHINGREGHPLAPQGKTRSAYIDYTTCVWSEAFSSDEDSIFDCPERENGGVRVITGIECVGEGGKYNYCAQKRVWCCGMEASFGRGVVSARPDPSLIESDFFDRNEGMKTVDLDDAFGADNLIKGNPFVTGLECDGASCERMALRSKLLKAATDEAILGEYLVENGGLENTFTSGGFDVSSSRCTVSDWFADGDGPQICMNNTFVSGIQCGSSRCRKLKMMCCSIGHVCPLGYYGNNIYCQTCPNGHYGDEEARTKYTCSAQCPPGRYGSQQGLQSSFCTAPCPQGTYRTDVGGVEPSDCTPCPAGRYGEIEGLIEATCTAPCPTGRYQPDIGGKSVKDCFLCPPGKYGDSTGLTYDCTRCLEGSFKREYGGKSLNECIDCPQFYTSNRYNTGCVRETSFYHTGDQPGNPRPVA